MTTTIRTRPFTVCLAAGLALTSIAEVAQADDELTPPAERVYASDSDDVFAPSSGPGFASFGLGPSVGVQACGDAGCGDIDGFNQFMLTQDLGWHVSGDGEGFALGVSFDEAFGDNLFRFQPGFKMWWDFMPSDEHGVYITPELKLGYGIAHADAGAFGSATDHYFDAQIGLSGRLVLGDVGMIYVRPVNLEVLANDTGTVMLYGASIGGGFTF